MFVVIRSDHGDCTQPFNVVGAYGTIDAASDAMQADVTRYQEEVEAEDDVVLGGVHVNGMPWACVDVEESPEWQVIEVELEA